MTRTDECRRRARGCPSSRGLVRRSPKGAGGFTLVELLVVIAIIGILAGLVYGAVSSSIARAKITSTRAFIASVDNAMQMFKTDFGGLPKNKPDYADSAAEVENDPEFIRLWLAGVNEDGEPDKTTAQPVRANPLWNGAYIEPKREKQMIDDYSYSDGDINEGPLAYVFVDAWGQRLYFNLYDPTESGNYAGKPIFNIEKWDIWSRGPDGLGTVDDFVGDGISMDDHHGSSYEDRREKDGTSYKRHNEVGEANRDNIGNWQ